MNFQEQLCIIIMLILVYNPPYQGAGRFWRWACAVRCKIGERRIQPEFMNMTRRAFLKIPPCLLALFGLSKLNIKPVTAVSEGVVFDGVGAHFDGAWGFDETLTNRIDKSSEQYTVYLPIVGRN